MVIHTIIQERRKALGLTQEQVAEYLGITTPAVNKWEKGSTCPDIALLPPLARLLKIDLNTLFGFFTRTLPNRSLSFFAKKYMKQLFQLALMQVLLQHREKFMSILTAICSFIILHFCFKAC